MNNKIVEAKLFNTKDFTNSLKVFTRLRFLKIIFVSGNKNGMYLFTQNEGKNIFGKLFIDSNKFNYFRCEQNNIYSTMQTDVFYRNVCECEFEKNHNPVFFMETSSNDFFLKYKRSCTRIYDQNIQIIDYPKENIEYEQKIYLPVDIAKEISKKLEPFNLIMIKCDGNKILFYGIDYKSKKRNANHEFYISKNINNKPVEYIDIESSNEDFKFSNVFKSYQLFHIFNLIDAYNSSTIELYFKANSPLVISLTVPLGIAQFIIEPYKNVVYQTKSLFDICFHKIFSQSCGEEIVSTLQKILPHESISIEKICYNDFKRKLPYLRQLKSSVNKI